MSAALWLMILGAPVAGLLAYAIGANDVANALGTTVGSGALGVRKASIFAGICEFAGTAALGWLVSGTLKSQVVAPSDFNDPARFALGMFCALTASAVWLIVATLLSLPVSTTQTIVGGILGFAVLELGSDAVATEKASKVILKIGLSWVVSPFLGCLVAGGTYLFLRVVILGTVAPHRRAARLVPFIASITLMVLVGFIATSIEQMPDVAVVFWVWIVVVCVCGGLMLGLYAACGPRYYRVRDREVIERAQARALADENADERDSARVPAENIPLSRSSNGYSSSHSQSPKERHSDSTIADHDSPAEEVDVYGALAEDKFVPLIVLTAVFVAFAHGANDVANAIGPYTAILEFYFNGEIRDDATFGTPWYVVLSGGVALVIGLLTLGHRVMATVGTKITKLSFSRGYSAQFGAALTVMLATYMAIPISTTTTLIGSISGAGLITDVPVSERGSAFSMRGLFTTSAIAGKVLLRIFAGWIVTVLVGFFLTMILYAISREML